MNSLSIRVSACFAPMIAIFHLGTQTAVLYVCSQCCRGDCGFCISPAHTGVFHWIIILPFSTTTGVNVISISASITLFTHFSFLSSCLSFPCCNLSLFCLCWWYGSERNYDMLKTTVIKCYDLTLVMCTPRLQLKFELLLGILVPNACNQIVKAIEWTP